MGSTTIGIGARLWLAFIIPWKLLFDGAFAARVHALMSGAPTAGELTEAPRPVAKAPQAPAQTPSAEKPDAQTQASHTPQPEAPSPTSAALDAPAEAPDELTAEEPDAASDAAAEVSDVPQPDTPETAASESADAYPEIFDEAAEPPAPSQPDAPDLNPALQILAILQREGRFLDFLQEDVSSFSDSDVGAAARVVHEGCKRGLTEYVTVEAIRSEEEGAEIVLADGFDSTQTRITGNVVGSPPFRGRLAHHGWKVSAIRLPTLSEGHDATIITPAEVEL